MRDVYTVRLLERGSAELPSGIPGLRGTTDDLTDPDHADLAAAVLARYTKRHAALRSNDTHSPRLRTHVMWLAKSASAAARNPECAPAAIGEALTETVNGLRPADTVDALLAHPRCPPDAVDTAVDAFTRRWFTFGSLDPDRYPDPTPHLICRLWETHEQLCMAGAFLAVEHPRCPESVVSEAACHADSGARAAAASNPQCPPATLEILAGDPSPIVRRAAARNPVTPEHARSYAALSA